MMTSVERRDDGNSGGRVVWIGRMQGLQGAADEVISIAYLFEEAFANNMVMVVKLVIEPVLCFVCWLKCAGCRGELSPYVILMPRN